VSHASVRSPGHRARAKATSRPATAQWIGSSIRARIRAFFLPRFEEQKKKDVGPGGPPAQAMFKTIGVWQPD
jgi:hypothetical protein